MKEDKCTKSLLAKSQVCAIFKMRDIWKNVLPKFIKLCMETPCRDTNMAALKIGNVFSPHKRFAGRQLNAASPKSLEIQASSLAKRRTLSK